MLGVGEWVAVAAEERATSGSFELIAFRVDIALFEVGLAVGDTDGGDRAIAVEVDVVFEEGREAVVGLDAVELNFMSMIVRT